MKSKPRPRITEGETERWNTPLGYLYITINTIKTPIFFPDYFEILLTIGKAGSIIRADMTAFQKIINRAVKYGVPVEGIIADLREIQGGDIVWDNGLKITSAYDAIARALDKFIGNKGDW